jgi:secreted PhoX family phosphatase
VVWEGNEERLGDPDNVGGYTMTSLADVLTYVNFAARALGATRTDRPEDIEIHPQTGDVYIAFTNNSNHGNFHGQIVRITEADGDHESLSFQWDIFAVGGPQSGFSSPDNLAFDGAGNLWVVTDVSSSSLNGGIYAFHGNNAMFMIPTSGDSVGQAFRFASGPVEAEMTGPTFVGNTLFLSVQHPGEVSESLDALTSHWPEGGDAQPRAAVIAITGPFSS